MKKSPPCITDLVPAADYTVDRWPPDSSRGGQHVGAGRSGVRVIHNDTGIVVCVDVARSGHVNRLLAVEALASILTNPLFDRHRA